MSYDKLSDKISINSVIYEGYGEDNVENDIRLADYYPDVERILKVENLPQITGKRITGDKLYVDGTLLTRVYYVSENSPILNCVAVSKMFSKTFDLPENAGGNAVAEVTAIIQYKNARLINPRKIELTASIGISVKVTECLSKEFLTDISCEGMQLYRNEITADTYVGCCERVQRINEELAVPETKPPVSHILKTCAAIVLNDIKAITNKAIMKGELKVLIIYMAEGGAVPERMEYVIPVTQIVDLEGIDENSRLCAKMTVDEHKLELLPTPTGDIRGIKVEAQITSTVCGYNEKNITVCKDAFSTCDEVGIAKNPVAFTKLIQNGAVTSIVKETLEFSKSEVKQIFDVWGALSFTDKEEAADKITVKANLCVTVMAFDHEDKLCCVDSDIPVVYEIPIREQLKNPNADVFATLLSVGYTISGESYIDIRAEISYNYAVFDRKEENILTDIQNEGKKVTDNLPLTVYFATEGEKVWDIAKAHNASVLSVMEDNNLDGDIIKKRCPIEIFGK